MVASMSQEVVYEIPKIGSNANLTKEPAKDDQIVVRFFVFKKF